MYCSSKFWPERNKNGSKKANIILFGIPRRFQQFSDDSRSFKISEDSRRLPKIPEDGRRFPKITENFRAEIRKLSTIFRRYIHLWKMYFYDLQCSTKMTDVIPSLSKAHGYVPHLIVQMFLQIKAKMSADGTARSADSYVRWGIIVHIALWVGVVFILLHQSATATTATTLSSANVIPVTPWSWSADGGIHVFCSISSRGWLEYTAGGRAPALSFVVLRTVLCLTGRYHAFNQLLHGCFNLEIYANNWRSFHHVYISQLHTGFRNRIVRFLVCQVFGAPLRCSF